MGYIETVLRGAVQVIRINNPSARNALSSAVLQELNLALTSADNSNTVRCILLTGTPQYFASGGNILEYMPCTAQTTFYNNTLKDFDTVRSMKSPVIAAVTGFALGGGLQVALQCDYIVAGHSAMLGNPELGIAAIPGVGASQVLPRLMGKSKAMEMILTTEWVSAQEAFNRRIVDKLVEDSLVFDTAFALCEEFSKWPRTELRALKSALSG